MRAEQAAHARFVSLARYADAAVGFILFSLCLLLVAAHPLAGGTFPDVTTKLATRSGVLFAVFAATWHGSFVLARLYDNEVKDKRTELARIFGATTIVSLLMLLAAFRDPMPLVPAVVLFWAAAITTTVLVRVVLRARIRSQGRRLARSIVVAGTGRRARQLVHDLHAHPRSHDRVVGFIDHSHDHPLPGWVRGMLLGTPDRLERLLMKGGVDEVVIALPFRSCYEDIRNILSTCERMGVDCRYPADLFDLSRAKPQVVAAPPRAMINMKVVPDGYRVVVKRVFDLFAASALLVLLAPVLAAIAVAIRIDSPGPIFFRQMRYGFRRRRFRMWKFRSMVADAAARHAELEPLNEASGPVFKIRDDPRVTRVGRFLRRSSLDELPQLFNVLRGEMSLVGPRPLSLRDVGRFAESSLMRRFSVMPGITGLWQVSGRSDRSFDEWMALDLQYIDEWSFGLELRILLRTFGAVIRQRGAC
jgi:exopolysaccharide biosynthesis polyprenyl glycosylphosphotransferase